MPRSRVAQVCLRSWKRMCGRPAFFKSGARLRWRRLDGLMGPPVSVVKTTVDGLRERLVEDVVDLLDRRAGEAGV